MNRPPDIAPSDISVRMLLTNLADALRDTGQLGLGLERTLVDVARHGNRAEPVSRQAAQDMDLLLQRLDDLSRFSDDLATQVERQVTVHPATVLSRVRLSGLVHALRDPDKENPGRSDGSVELF
ncbi:MAG: hypothetical protein WCD16_13620 [Paracoccaceae bacterium]